MRWAILGGGLTGVTLARLLHEAGEELMVLEKEENIGGLCRSRTSDGFTFDLGGSHIIFSRDTAVLSFMNEVLRSNRAERKRNTKIFYKGLMINYPFENGLFDLPKEDLFFCINEYIKTIIAAEKGDIPEPANFKDWILATFGRGIAECYMIPYNEKIWNYPTDQMSAHWMEGRVPRPPVEDIIKSAIGIPTEGYTHQSVFSYPIEGGIEALVRAIADPVKSTIRTNSQVNSLRRRGDMWVIGDGRDEYTADQVISTIPLQHLLPCLSDLPPEVQQACDALKYNSLISVCIGFAGLAPPLSWVYIPEATNGYFNRISFPSNYSDAVAPKGHASILAEITYNEGDTISSLSDQEILADTLANLTRMGLIPEGVEIVHTSVARSTFAYVVYDLDYLKNIRIVRSYLEGIGIHLVGRFSEFEYLNMDGCIRSAMKFMERLS
ncbi:NAD(P)/FAD-dependent oxidoreductase [Methanocalculus sp.]|uniref:protoporphyrinogen/coproporphyrinogen oxidase n=1 Tax=Methanocalculus sp. TaxID=2004547 RepID=UPI0027239171|nr:FAD-dependent oxidoreductase [Methanocalculus sp.]MDO8840850.1 FAD-dependent oxidoreductase [Methanocalculus sp.]